MRKSIFALILASFLAMALPGFSQTNAMPPHPPMAKGHAMMMRDHCGPHDPFAALHLTDAQRKQLHVILEQTMQSALPLHLELMKKKIELAQIFANPDSTRAAVEQKSQEIAALKPQVQELHINAYFSIMGILTPEQRGKFSRFVAMHIAQSEGGEEHFEHSF